MGMALEGFAKLVEELGELCQIAGGCPATEWQQKLEEEIGDTQAIINFVVVKHNLNPDLIEMESILYHSHYYQLDNFKAIGVLIENIGFLHQVVGKVLAYGVDADHPDGEGVLRIRLERAIARINAAISRVSDLEQLDQDKINERIQFKRATYKEWDSQP